MGVQRVGVPRGGCAHRLVRAVAWLVVLAVMSEGIATTRPAAADGLTGGQLVPCSTDLCVTGVIQPPLYVQQPYDRIVQYDPTSPANNAWMSLEDEARVAIATLHGTPNDRRLVYWARDEIRGYMYLRLIDVVNKKKNGGTLTAQEQSWYDLLRNDVQKVRIARAQSALDEYSRWENNPCSFQPPAGFGFAPLAKDASCNGGSGVTFSQPPTAEQFQAYAAANVAASQGLNTPDAAAAAQRMRNVFTLLGGIAAAGVAALALASLILAVPFIGSAIAFAFGTAAGAAAFGAWAGSSLTSTVVASAAASVGIGAATGAAVIFIVVIGAIVTAIAFYQVLEGAKVKPTLEDALAKATTNSFDLGALLGTEQGGTDLFGVFLARTLPDYSAQIAANEPGPPLPTIADRNFVVDGDPTPTNYLETRTWDDQPQLAYVSGDWWAVSVNGGPFRWSPTLYFLGKGSDGSVQQAAAMISGDDFVVSSPGIQAGVDSFAYRTRTLTYLWAIGAQPQTPTSTAELRGNHRPTLAPTVTPAEIVQGSLITFRANAADVDPGDTVSVQWIVQPEPELLTLVVANDPSNVDCTDPGIDPTNCSWPRTNAADVAFVRKTPGTYFARVIATDSKGAKAVTSFTFTVTNRAPRFLATPTVTVEGRTATLRGTFSDPGSEAVTATVQWGDGQFTTITYPCPLDQPTVVCGIGPADDPTQVVLKHTYPQSSLGSDLQPVIGLSDGIDSTTTRAAPFRLPFVPVVSPTVSPASPVEGDTLTFDANALSSEPGATVSSVVWVVEPEPVGFVDPANEARCRAPGAVADCTWPRYSGAQVQLQYRREGTYLARVIATDSLGQVAIATTSFTVGNAPPAFVLGPTARVVGSTLTVSGRVSDPGQDGIRLTIDWGDGTSTTRQFPCDSTGGAICFGLPTAADRPTTFSFPHTYTGALPDPTRYPTITAGDGTVVTAPVVPTYLRAPKPPTDVVATASGPGRLSVTFTPPTDNGGSSITSYRTVCSSSDGGIARSVSGLLSGYVVSGLTEGRTYVCRAAAQNELGWSTASSPSASVVVLGRPGAPTGVSAVQAGPGQLSVAFTPGIGSPATSFRAVCTSSDGGVTRDGTSTASPVVVSRLTGGVHYSCSVVATNAVGNSVGSAPSNSVSVLSVPAAPTITQAILTSPTRAMVSVVAGATGGSAILGYRVVCTSPTGASRSASGSSTTLIITFLTAGAAYTCRASANSIVGSSPASTAVPLTSGLPI